MTSSQRRNTTQFVIEPENEKIASHPHESQFNESDSRAEAEAEAEAEANVLKTYSRLADGEVRILQLLPGKAGEDVCCDLITVRLATRPYYEAISYAWGTSFRMTPIVLNGIRCFRRHNLLACLANLRHETNSRALWADALCINQSDVEERNSQLEIMPEVYRLAQRTLIWLGDDEPNFFHSLPNSVDGSTLPQTLHLSESLQFLARFAKDQHIYYTEKTAALLHGLHQLCKFDWWSRMWVVQETLLPASAHVMLGKTILSWDTVSRAAASILHHMSTCCRQPNLCIESTKYEKTIKDDISTCVEIIQSFQRIPYETNNDLLAHLWTFRNRLSSVKHDKVYGIMGLLRRESLILQPDYKGRFTTLCRAVILKDIQLSNNLKALQGIRESDLADVSSWSIDWSYLDYWSEDRARILDSIYKQVYTASLHHVPRVAVHDIDLSWDLDIAGRVLDQVVYASHSLVFDNSVRENQNYRAVLTALDALRRLKEWSGDDAYITGGSYLNAFWKTLAADCIIPHNQRLSATHSSQDSPPIRRALSSDFLAFTLWLRSLSGGHFAMHDIVTEGNGDGDSTRALISKPTRPHTYEETLAFQHAAERLRRLEAVQAMGASVVRATSGRCMFVTARGYLGLGPHSLQVGDAIAILLGGCTPFALEHCGVEGLEDEQWRLLGDCYVHGWMDGELVRGENTEEWGNLVLR